MKKLIILNLLILLNSCAFEVEKEYDCEDCDLKNPVEEVVLEEPNEPVEPEEIDSAEIPEEPEPPKDPFKDCETIIYHNVEHSMKGIYVSKNGDAYNVTVDYEELEDFFRRGVLSGKDIGFLAYLSAKVYKKKEYPNAKLVKEKLQNIHVIVPHTKEEFARLYLPFSYKDDQEKALERAESPVAFIHSTKPKCFADIPEEANIVYIIRSAFMSNAYTAIHELAHPVGHYGFGDEDGDHDDERLWSWHSDDSIVTEVQELYEASLKKN
jgi:hypothetical protein